jgi:hypothetical protein
VLNFHQKEEAMKIFDRVLKIVIVGGMLCAFTAAVLKVLFGFRLPGV